MAADASVRVVPDQVQTAGRSVLGAAQALRGGGRGWTLLSVAFGWLLILGLRFAVPALLPQVKAEFHLSNATAGVAITVIWMAYGLMQFPAGMLVDRVGERRLLAGSLLLAGASVGALGVAPVFAVFLVACAALGLGTGLYGPPRGLILSKMFPENDGAAFGFTLAAGSIGGATIPALAGLLATRVGWRLAVVVSIPLYVLVGAALWRSVPTTAGEGSRMSLVPDFETVAAAVANRRVAVSVSAVTALLFAFQALTAFLPTYLVETKGLSPGTAAGFYALLFVFGAGFQLSAGSAADRFGDRAVIVAITAFSVLPLLALPFATGPLAIGVLVALLGARLGAIPVSNAYIVAALPDEVQGTTWGLLRTSFFVVGATGSTVVGLLADRGFFDGAFFLLGGITALAAGLFLFLPPRRR